MKEKASVAAGQTLEVEYPFDRVEASRWEDDGESCGPCHVHVVATGS